MKKKIILYLKIYGILLLYCFIHMVALRFTLFNGATRYLITDGFLWMFLNGVVTTIIYNVLYRYFLNWNAFILILVGFIISSIYNIITATIVMGTLNPKLLNSAAIVEIGLSLFANFNISGGV